jgi:hypothetical protein
MKDTMIGLVTIKNISSAFVSTHQMEINAIQHDSSWDALPIFRQASVSRNTKQHWQENVRY